jgi:NAD(P)-dependent dehydrogenase (short-subunit alcohol dehydrogenase family)
MTVFPVFATPADDASYIVEGIRASGGNIVTGILADAATEEGAATLIKTARQVDTLVNNVGIYESKDFIKTTDADWRTYFETNVLSGARLARAYLPSHRSLRRRPWPSQRSRR